MGWQDFPVVGQQGSAPAATPEQPEWMQYPVVEQPKPAAAQSAENVSSIPSADQFAHWMTFGLSDKAASLGAATGAALPGSAHPGDFWDTYSKHLQGLRDKYSQYSEAHPIANIAGSLGGGLLGAPGAAGAAAIPSIGQAIGKSALGGAVLGGAAGAGEAPAGENWIDTAKNAGLGGLAGAAIGAVIPPAVQALRPVVESVAQMLPKYAPNAVANAALKRITERAGQDEAAGGPTIESMASALIPGKPMGLVDVGGENLLGLAGNLARAPGESREIARNFFTARDADAGTRLIADIDQHVSSGTNAPDAINSLLQQRSAAAAPLYNKAFSYPVSITPKLQSFIGDPIIQQGLVAGREIQRLEGLAGNPVPQPQSVWGQLDAAKRGLDDMIDKARDPLTGRLDQRGRAINNVRAAYVKELDSVNPDYAAARQAFAGPSQMMDATRQGQGFQSMRPEEIRDQIAKMSAPEKDFFLLGVADKLRQNVSSTALAGDESKRLVNNKLIQLQLRPMFQNQADYDSFIQKVMAERTMFETKTPVIGGSQTASRMSEDTHGPSNPLIKLATGALAMGGGEKFYGGSMLLRGAKEALDRLSQPSQAVREAMAKMVFNSNDQLNQLLLQAMQRRPPSAAPPPWLLNPAANVAGRLAPPLASGGQ